MQKRSTLISGFIFLTFLLMAFVARADDISKAVKFQHWELSPSVVFYNGDALRGMTLGQFALTYHANETYWIGADFTAGSLGADDGNGLDVKPKSLFYTAEGAFYWNLAALLGASSVQPNLESAANADFYTSIGGGILSADKKKTGFGFIGGGMAIHTGWTPIRVRFDLKNSFYVLQNSQGDNLNSDLALACGLSWML